MLAGPVSGSAAPTAGLIFALAGLLGSASFAASGASENADTSVAKTVVQSHGGETAWWINKDALEPLGIRVARLDKRTDSKPENGHYLEWHFAAASDSGFRLRVQGNRFDRLEDGALRHRGGPVFELPQGELDLRGFRVQRRAGGAIGLDVADAQGLVWFQLDHAHEYLDTSARTFAVKYMDLRLAPALAQRLGRPEFAGMLVGGMQSIAAELEAVSSPVAAAASSCTATYPEPGLAKGGAWVDVRMLNLAVNWEERSPDGVNVYRCGRPDGNGGHSLICTQGSIDGVVVLSPDASLRNDGTASVAWHPKFTAPNPPYNNDQHPYLMWNMYRVNADGSLHQIGVSALKHAFHTINAACGCGQGEVLYPTCEDTYGGFSNDYPASLAPRTEIIPHTAQWGRCGSLYDKDCDGNPDTDFGALPDDAYTPAKHFGVVESELDGSLYPGARWFVEYWYVIRDDVNPYNNFGLLEVMPTKVRAQGSDPDAWIWRFSNGDFHNEPMVDYWTTLAPAGSVTQVQERESAFGRVRVAVRATPRSGGAWRYDYAVFNLDYARVQWSGAEPNLRILSTRGLNSVSVPVSEHAKAADAAFYGIGASAAPWSCGLSATAVTWKAPPSLGLSWGTTYVYSFTAGLPPADGVLVLQDGAPGSRSLNVPTLAPTSTRDHRARPAALGDIVPQR
jgi:hypothetical protein